MPENYKLVPESYKLMPKNYKPVPENYRLVPESYKPRAGRLQASTTVEERPFRAAISEPKSAGLQPLWAYLLFTALCPARQAPPPYCKIDSDGRESRRSFKESSRVDPRISGLDFGENSIHTIR